MTEPGKNTTEVIRSSLARRHRAERRFRAYGITAVSFAVPAWWLGILFILVFAFKLSWFPAGGMYSNPPPDPGIERWLDLAKHAILPVITLVLVSVGPYIYSVRTMTVTTALEDHVQLARAKGLPDRDVNNKYILRPTLPTIITSFALLVIAMWLGAPILETIFNWPGLGRALYQAVTAFDTPVIIGSTVIFSYMLAITVFLLDIVYALVDPRVKIGDEGSR